MIFCNNQSEVDAAQGANADIQVDAPDLCIRVGAAKTLQVVACKTLDVIHAKIRKIDAEYAKIGEIHAEYAKIGEIDAKHAKIERFYAEYATIKTFLYTNAHINGAKITPPTPKQISVLDHIRKDVLEKGLLDMSIFHNEKWSPEHPVGTCGTTHCLAGSAQALSAESNIREMYTVTAGNTVLPCCAALWFMPQEYVERYLRNREYTQADVAKDQ